MLKQIITLIILLFPIISFAVASDAEMILYKANVFVEKGKLTSFYEYEIRINTRMGEKYTRIALPFSKLVKISKINALILNNEGTLVRKLEKSDITERSSYSEHSFFEDELVKEFDLNYSSYPYTIKYSYQIEQSEFLQIERWVPVLDLNIPTIHAELLLTIPKKYPVQFNYKNIGGPSKDSTKIEYKYRWELTYNQRLDYEMFSPGLVNFLPVVTIVPQNFKFQSEGSFVNWESFGNWQWSLLKDKNKIPVKEKMKILSIIEGVLSDTEKVKKLYHYLQDETRYVNISLETGGLIPYAARYVAENKYGDCKALSNYFKSILELVGIKSHYTLVMAGNPIIAIAKDFPSQQFNHVILLIPVEKDSLWLDCTSDGPFNYLGTFTQNRDVLIIEESRSSFVKTPALAAVDVEVKRNIEVKYLQDTAAVATINTSYKGKSFEYLLNLQNSLNQYERDIELADFITKSGFEPSNYQLPEWKRDTHEIQLIYNAISEKYYKKYEKDIVLESFAFQLPIFEKPENRRLPVQIDYPIFKTDSILFEIPQNYKLKDLYSQCISNRFGEYKLKVWQNQKNICIVKSLLLKPGTFSLNEYNEFYKFIIDIKKIEQSNYLTLILL